jgi:hypothetical protein
VSLATYNPEMDPGWRVADRIVACVRTGLG